MTSSSPLSYFVVFKVKFTGLFFFQSPFRSLNDVGPFRDRTTLVFHLNLIIGFDFFGFLWFSLVS